MTIDKNALEVFVMVAQTRNFRLAAERLGVTRPAISQTLRRLEDRLQANGWQGTFYVLRHLDAQGLVGALYAAEANGQKAYEPTGSWKALKSMAAVSSRRLHVVASNPAVLTFVFLAGLLPIWMLCALLLPSSLSLLGTVAAAGLYGYWLTLPMVRARTYVGFEEAERQLKAEGFDVSQALSHKY